MTSQPKDKSSASQMHQDIPFPYTNWDSIVAYSCLFVSRAIYGKPEINENLLKNKSPMNGFVWTCHWSENASVGRKCSGIAILVWIDRPKLYNLTELLLLVESFI